MKSAWMMRPQKGGDAVIGPFIEKPSLEAVLTEMGRLAMQAGQGLVAFFPAMGSEPSARVSALQTQRENGS
jgi:hypothetical protein